MHRRLRLLTAGEHGVLVELDSLAEVLEMNQALGATRPAGVIDVIPAARTLLVQFDPMATSRQSISRWLTESSSAGAITGNNSTTVRIPVRYDGADLAEVSRWSGLSTAEVVAAHRDSDYVVAFCGFAPGFAYLTGLPTELRMPRRSTPRTAVPAGSVSLADEFTAVYPRSSPGGWQLIGHTDLTVFDIERDPPALLTPGTPVRFIEIPDR